jgi:hypothetical protein
MPKPRCCTICASELQGRQRKYCSRVCKNKDTNHHHQSYLAQQVRGMQRKVLLIKQLGGRCVRCGYRRNHAALALHHVDPKLKSFELDLRTLSNRSPEAIAAESAKCILLCQNCHAEEHFPQFAIAAIAKQVKRRDRNGKSES